MGGAGLCMSPRALKVSPEEAMLSPSMRRLPLSAMRHFLSPLSSQKRKRTDAPGGRDSLSLSAARTERLSTAGGGLFGPAVGGTPPTGGRLPTGMRGGTSELCSVFGAEPGSAARGAAAQRSLFNSARPPISPHGSDASSPHTTSPPTSSGPGSYMLGAVRSRPFRTITIRPVAPASPPAQEGGDDAAASARVEARSVQLARQASLDSIASDGTITRALNTGLGRLSVTPHARAGARGTAAGADGPLTADELLPMAICYDELVASVCADAHAAACADRQALPPAAGGKTPAGSPTGGKPREADKENAPTAANERAGAVADADAGNVEMALAIAAGAGAGAGAMAHSAAAQEPPPPSASGAIRRWRSRSEMLLAPSQIVAIESDYQRRNQE